MSVPVLRGVATGASSASGTSIAVARSAATQVGDVVVVVFGLNTNIDLTPPDSSWTKQAAYQGAVNSTSQGTQVWTKTATTAGAQTYTFTLGAGRNWSYAALSLSTVRQLAGQVTVATKNNSTDASVSGPALTTTGADAFLVAVFVSNASVSRGQTYTVGGTGGYTKQADLDAGNTGTSTSSHHLTVATATQAAAGATGTVTFVRSDAGTTGNFPEVILAFYNLPNTPPTANAGPDQTVPASDAIRGTTTTVQLAGSGAATGGTVASYTWRIVSNSGPAVSLSSTSAQNPTVQLPARIAASAETIVAGLVVTDSNGLSSTEDTMQITVTPPPPYGRVRRGGVWVYRRIWRRVAGAWA